MIIFHNESNLYNLEVNLKTIDMFAYNFLLWVLIILVKNK